MGASAVTTELTELEVRILACLIEKGITTPEYYPLTLNALTNACNQKSNRHPVLALEQEAVVRGLDRLQGRGFSVTTHVAGSHVPKYRHAMADRLPLNAAEIAVLCELMLRGPQTVGELKSRAGRMHPFADLAEVQETLRALSQRDEPLVVELPRQPGRKEPRHGHLLSGEPDVQPVEAAELAPEAATLKVMGENERISALETRQGQLEAELAQLKEAFAVFREQFE